MRRRLSIDFETRSLCDLKACGVEVYSENPWTGVWCMAWAFDDEPPSVWLEHEKFPQEVVDHVCDGGAVAGWNIGFEYYIWNSVLAGLVDDLPRLEIEQLDDTMARAYAAALPGALDKCGEALGTPVQKDMIGKRVMRRMMRPKAINDDCTVTWHDDPAMLARLAEYCQTDVDAERAIGKRLPTLSDRERKLWIIDRRINDRGLLLDTASIRAANQVVRETAAERNATLREITGWHAGGATNVAKLARWLREAHGVETERLTKRVVEKLLAAESTPGEAKAALAIRQEVGKASTAKLRSMRQSQCSDGRARGLLRYHVATTGRWAGVRVQPQNMPRPIFEEKEAATKIGRTFEALRSAATAGAALRRELDVSPAEAIASSLRGMFVPAAGHRFIGGDFSNIEGRVLAWLAGEHWKLKAFRERDEGSGHDLYVLTYARSFGIGPEYVTKKQRQTGKTQELAGGYQGGVGSFISMAETTGANLQDIIDNGKRVFRNEALAEARERYLMLPTKPKLDTEDGVVIQAVVLAWRAANPQIVRLWYDLQDAAIAAVLNPGEQRMAANGRIVYVCRKGALWCRLPSGRVLAYQRPDIAYELNKRTGRQQPRLTYWAVNGATKKYEKHSAYGGLLANNVTQGAARDILADTLHRIEGTPYRVVLHTHDEVLCEVRDGVGSAHELRSQLCTLEPWAKGLPIAAECEESYRYSK